MRKPEIILDIFNQRSKNDLIIKDVYKCFYNEEFYKMAFSNLTDNKNLLDENNKEYYNRVLRIIDLIKLEQYKWNKIKDLSKVRLNCGFNRNLIVSEWNNKIVQNIMYDILFNIYEPIFSDRSHYARPNKGIHTALTQISNKGQANEFFIYCKIPDIVNSINNNYLILLDILRQKINDGRFIELIRKMFVADKFKLDFYNYKTYSDTLTGGTLSPLLLNIYLNELDKFIKNNFESKFNVGAIREKNKDYRHICDKKERLSNKLKNKRGSLSNSEIIEIQKEIKELQNKIRKMPTRASIELCKYRRFSYTRYCNEWIISFTGTFNEANEIKNKINNFLKNVLNLSAEINIKNSTNKKDPARFLNYNIVTQYSSSYIVQNKRRIAGIITFMIPNDIITKFIKKYSKNNKPIHLPERINDSVFDIISQYQYEYEGICQYYKFARNKKKLNKLNHVIQSSLLKTLSYKLKKSTTKVVKMLRGTFVIDNFTYKTISTTITSEDGTVYETHFGAVPLKHKNVSNYDPIDDEVRNLFSKRTNKSNRLIYIKCSMCDSNKDI